jgi:hypothetical protein
MRLKREKLKCIITGSDLSGPMPARVSVFDAENNYYAPAESFFYGYSTASEWSADWGIKGVQKYFYTHGEFELALPCKAITVKISHGLEYESFEQKIEIKSDINILKIELKRIINMPKLGWYCGDNHTHYTHGPVDYDLTEQDGLFCAAAEGLDFVCFLNNKLAHPVSIESGKVKGHFAYEYGHHPVLNTGICPPKDLTCSLKDRGDWFSLNDWVRENDGVIIMGHPLFANHLYSGLLADDSQAAHMTHYEIPINAISGKIDTFELQNNRLSILETWLQIWYRLLNCGINLPLSAGTDACISVKSSLPLGIYRSYVQAKDNEFDSYLAGLKAGHSFISDGPLLFLDINGKGPGKHIELDASNNKLRIELQVKSIFPLPGVELVQNGEVIKRWDLNGEKDFKASYDIKIKNSCWLALRVLQLRKKTDDSEVTELFAHTNAVFVDYNAKPRNSSADALFFLQWIEVVKKYRLGKPDNESAAVVIAEASQKYEKQLNDVDAKRWNQLKQNINDQEIASLVTDDVLVIDSNVSLRKEKDSSHDIECIVKSMDLASGCFYKLSAKCRRQNGISTDKTAGYTYGKIVVFDEIGTYLGVAEDKTPGGAWCDISTLIYLPGNSKKIQIAYCLEATGFIEFKDVIINKLKGDIFKIIK